MDSLISMSTTALTVCFFFLLLEESLTDLIFPTTRRPIGYDAAGSCKKPSQSSFSMTRPSTWRESRTKQPFLLVSTTNACTISLASGISSESRSPSSRLERRLTSTIGLDGIPANTRQLTNIPCGYSPTWCCSLLTDSSSSSSSGSMSIESSSSPSSSSVTTFLSSCFLSSLASLPPCNLPRGMLIHSSTSSSSVIQQRPTNPPRKFIINAGASLIGIDLLIWPTTRSPRRGLATLYLASPFSSLAFCCCSNISDDRNATSLSFFFPATSS
mmetsp:Transcript_29115/g.40946  ORF Transcript_29115/g.40946 Transcript_29115/m.40946 type:complete len:271 (-) Transcript_29115:2352-3164(-)